MIVRESSSTTGEPVWQLIKQPDHAYLSAEIAKDWGNPPFLKLRPYKKVFEAIEHHDDGWRIWEESPEVDPATGNPLSFLEMPAPDSHQLWSQSIEDVAVYGPFAQYLVASHFVILREQSESVDSEAGQAFLTKYKSKIEIWLEQWLQESDQNTWHLAQTALAQIRFFDWISLWFCMAEREKPTTFSETPCQASFTISPVNQTRFLADPWPWQVNQIKLKINATEIAKQSFQTSEQLCQTPRKQVQLNWLLEPKR